MRYLVLVLSLLLVSCATPQTAPQSFYAGVYVPGKVEFKERGKFMSSAGVFSKSDLPTARKAAFARLMLEAKNKGYKYFEITSEKTTSGIGKTFRVFGQALKSPRYNGRTYDLNNIRSLLRGANLVALKRPAPPTKKVVKSKRLPKPVSRPAVTPVSAPIEEPIGEPTVIMAPEDITGSVRKSPAKRTNGASVSTSTNMEIELPDAVSDLPKGVLLRSN